MTGRNLGHDSSDDHGNEDVFRSAIGEGSRRRKIFQLFVITIGACFLSFLAAVYVVFCPVLNKDFVDTLLFWHEDFRPAGELLLRHRQAKSREVSFQSADGKSKIYAQLHIRNGASRIAILSHGKGLNVFSDRFKAECLLDAGVSVLAYDYRGYGLSEGKPSVPGIVEDLVSAYEYLVGELDYKPNQIILYGESIGTGVTSEASKRIECGAIVLDSSFKSLYDIGVEQVPPMIVYPPFLFPKPALSNMEMVREKHPPLLLVAGVQDKQISVEHTKALYEHAIPPKSILLLSNSGHIFFHKDREEFVTTLTKFFRGLEKYKIQ